MRLVMIIKRINGRIDIKVADVYKPKKTKE